MKVGYARVSTQEQTLGLQVGALKQKGCEISTLIKFRGEDC